MQICILSRKHSTITGIYAEDKYAGISVVLGCVLAGCSGVTIVKLNEHGNDCSRKSQSSTSVFIIKHEFIFTQILTNPNFFSYL